MTKYPPIITPQHRHHLLPSQKPTMPTTSTLLLAFALLATTHAHPGSPYAASILSAVASASANLQDSVLSALAEATAAPEAIASNAEAEISAVLATLDQFTSTADPALLSSIEAKASAIGFDFNLESDLEELTGEAEETGSLTAVSAEASATDDANKSSETVTSQADSTSAAGRSTSHRSASSSHSSTTASASDNIGAVATSLPAAAVGAGLALLALL
jgi:hypothetical protein